MHRRFFMKKLFGNLKIDMTKKEKWTTFGVTLGILVLLLIVPIAVVFGALRYPRQVFAQSFSNLKKVGYETEILATYDRTPPTEMKDEGLVSNGTISAYPTYAHTPAGVLGGGADQVAKRNAIIAENWALCSINTRVGSDGYPRNTYNRMDKDGNLFLNDVPYVKNGNEMKLYKHTGAQGMYLGEIDPKEKAVVKKLTFAPRGYTRGYNVTGVYAPAGEVIKVEISEKDMNATSGISIHIGQALYNAKANNIWTGKNQMQRMPVILNTMVVDKNTATFDEEKGVYTAYIGSFFGGPIYVCNETVQFSVTISGGVPYSHFILGYTTREEFEKNSKSSVPFFDLEVWEYGVLHSGPKRYAEPFSYDQLNDVAVLWEKISLVSTYNNRQGIVFLYDPFVAAGAAVAFPSQGAVNCPMDWMASSLNYQSFVNSGAWGNMHEYNHNFQNYGFGYTGEVTNNGLNLVSYSLFTKISAARRMGSYGGEGLGGWNSYTSATWALERVKRGDISSTSGLAVYSTLLHNFGQDVFLNARSFYGANYLNRFAALTHQDFSYFASLITNYTGNLSLTETDYPTFVPVSCVYQTGRSYMFDGKKKYIETMQPYVIQYGKSFVVDLNPYKTNSAGQYESGSIVLPDGFSYKIKSVSKPANGKIWNSGKNVWKFAPNKNMNSGKIYVTLEIKNENDPNMKIDDVELVLEFEQSHEMNKNILEKKVYTSPQQAHLYETAQEAYEDGFKKYHLTYNGDNVNTSQNANTEIWGGHNDEFNTMKMISGKLYVATDGDYRITMRGRNSVFGSYTVVSKNKQTNGKKYNLAINKDTGSNINSANFKNNIEEYSITIPSLQTGDWIKFDAVVRVTTNYSFVGLCWGRFAEPMITTHLIDPNDESKGSQMIYGSANQTITFPDGTQKLITTNSVITDEEAALLKPTISVSYASAYRSSYEFAHTFESEYFYTPEYHCTDKIVYEEKGQLVKVEGYRQAPGEQYNINVLFDEDDTNFIHNDTYDITSENPFDLTVDLQKEIVANSMTIYGEPTRAYQPKDFIVYAGTSLETMHEIASVTNSQRSNNNVVVKFDRQALRYYRIVVTDTHANGNKAHAYIAYRCIKFSYDMSQAKLISPDDKMLVYRGNWQSQNKLSTFGHIYAGRNAQMEFTFTGTQFAIYSYKGADFDKFEVCIDGKTMPAVSISGKENKVSLAYLSPELKNKKHTIIIRSKKNFNIDSVAIWG